MATAYTHRKPNPLLKFASHTKLTASLYILDFVLCTYVFMLIEHRSLLDSIWWCTVTWFTVGYGDLYSLTEHGRIFSMFAIISSHVLIVLVTANFVAKLSQHRAETLAAERAATDHER